MEVLDIKQEAFFPITFRLLGFGLSAAGIIFLNPLAGWHGVGIILLGVVLLWVGLMVSFARYGLIIDIDQPSYTVYSKWLLWKSGKPERFDRIEKFYINRVKETTNVAKFSGAVSQVSNYVFKAYMLLDNGEKIHVDTDRSEEKLSERVRQYENHTASILDYKNH